MEENLPVELERERPNLFLELVPEAKSTLRRIMLNSSNEKIAKEVAQDILDRGGETKKMDLRTAPVVQIRDSQVQLLVKAAQEAME